MTKEQIEAENQQNEKNKLKGVKPMTAEELMDLEVQEKKDHVK